jgi:hypothetical protein
VKQFLSGILTLIVCFGSIEANTSARKAGFVLLREGVGARAAAMGEAQTAVVGDQTASFWNPAGVAAMRGKDFLLAHHRSFQGINQGYGGWAYGNNKRGLALSLGVYGTGGLEARRAPTAEPAGTFSVYDLNAGLSYAQRIGQRIYTGFTIRALHENIGPESAWGVGTDFGLLYRLSDELMLGATYRNLGRMELLDQERIPLPRVFRFGAAWSKGALTGAVDFRVPEVGTKGANVGVEYVVVDRLFLRGGLQTGHDTPTWSFGLGVTRRNWRVDYAFVPTSQGLGESHRIAVGIR